MLYKIEIKWAVIFLIMSLLWVWVEKLYGLHGPKIEKHYLYTQLFIIPTILIYVFALREKRRKEFISGMNYRQGLITGLYVSAFITMLSPLIQLIIFEVITPGFFDSAIQYAASSGKFTQTGAESYYCLRNFILQSMTGSVVIGNTASIVIPFFTDLPRPKKL